MRSYCFFGFFVFASALAFGQTSSRHYAYSMPPQYAHLVSKVDPVYPAAAKKKGIQGTVDLSIVVGKDGHVVKVFETISGNALLVDAAKEAVMKWVYRPTLLNGEPVEVIAYAHVPFVLPKKEAALEATATPPSR